jgi:hypothetical protein
MRIAHAESRLLRRRTHCSQPSLLPTAPMLPVEFARESSNGLIRLVLGWGFTSTSYNPVRGAGEQNT